MVDTTSNAKKLLICNVHDMLPDAIDVAVFMSSSVFLGFV